MLVRLQPQLPIEPPQQRAFRKHRGLEHDQRGHARRRAVADDAAPLAARLELQQPRPLAEAGGGCPRQFHQHPAIGTHCTPNQLAIETHLDRRRVGGIPAGWNEIGRQRQRDPVGRRCDRIGINVVATVGQQPGLQPGRLDHHLADSRSLSCGKRQRHEILRLAGGPSPGQHGRLQTRIAGPCFAPHLDRELLLGDQRKGLLRHAHAIRHHQRQILGDGRLGRDRGAGDRIPQFEFAAAEQRHRQHRPHNSRRG